MILYFVASYGSIALAGRFLHGHKVANRFKLRSVWVWPVYVVLATIPLAPYIKVAIQTSMYSKELLPAFVAGSTHTVVTVPNREVFIFRVLNVSRSHAEVYAVNSCSDRDDERLGWVMELTKTSKGWQFEDYDFVWSDCGSAKGNTFPPYPEARSL